MGNVYRLSLSRWVYWIQDSIAISSDSNWNPYLPPSIEHEVAYHCKSANGTQYEKIPKKEWKIAWRQYRQYMKGSMESDHMPDCSPAGESDISVNNLGGDGGAILFGYM